MSTSEQRASKPQRILACVLCQQRKIKCERKFPCSSCVKSGAQCVPAALIPRQRRRRFPERELLERLRHYEDLLRQNKIAFEPLHATTPASDKASPGQDHPEDDSPAAGEESKGVYDVFETKSMWRAMNQKYNDDGPEFDGAPDDSDSANEDVHVLKLKKAWDSMDSNDSLLFGSHCDCMEVPPVHPSQVQIFKLWQIYIQNVNPLIRVIHVPSFQPKIIDAAGNVAAVSPVMEALMLSIYCAALNTISDAECESSFGQRRDQMLRMYQAGCMRAMRRSSFLRTDDYDCLTALHLYLISVRSQTIPRAIVSMTAVAIRIAQRMHIHDEDSNRKCPPFEAEMRRRLWWSIVAFDSRMCELSNCRETTLNPLWSCALPLNVDDFNMQPAMKAPPVVHGRPTEAIFAVVKSEICDMRRNSVETLDFYNPYLKLVARLKPSSLDATERRIEDDILSLCSLENPLQAMTVWMARVQLAKARLVHYYAKHWRNSVGQTDAERDTAIQYSMRMLENDTKLMTSPAVKGFKWLMQFQYPMPAFIHIIQDMRRRPIMKHADAAWQALSDNYMARFNDSSSELSPFVLFICRQVLQAWAACEEVMRREPPAIVTDMRAKRAAAGTPDSSSVGDDVDMLPSFPMPFVENTALPWQMPQMVFDGKEYANDPTQALLINDWSTTNWNTMQGDWF